MKKFGKVEKLQTFLKRLKRFGFVFQKKNFKKLQTVAKIFFLKKGKKKFFFFFKKKNKKKLKQSLKSLKKLKKIKK